VIFNLHRKIIGIKRNGPEGIVPGSHMKRDMDLIRTILLDAEVQCSGEAILDFEIENYESEAVYYHLLILEDSGLLIVSDEGTSLNRRVLNPVRLTWEGHEFLDAMRSDTTWNEVKSRMNGIGGFVIDVAKALAADIMRRELGL
jgi:hypothetical protein